MRCPCCNNEIDKDFVNIDTVVGMTVDGACRISGDAYCMNCHTQSFFQDENIKIDIDLSKVKLRW